MKMKATPAPTIEELSERIENLKARYTKVFGLDLDGNEVEVKPSTSNTFVAFETNKLWGFVSKDIDRAIENARWSIEIEADSIESAKNKVIRSAKNKGLVEYPEDFGNWEKDSKMFLKPIKIGQRGCIGGIYLVAK